MAPIEPIHLATNRRTAAFERRVARALAPHLAHIEAGTPIVVACSGGPDSLATLVAVARGAGRHVIAAHFDHRHRAASEIAGERALVEAVAAAAGARFAAGRATRTPTDRSESFAREARYRWLARACATAGAPVCVTGHTLDDQAETVLLRLVRGTGLGGVAGMAARSDWPVAARGVRAPMLVRPLLGIARADVEAYLDALGLEAARDPSNDTLDYARNRIRQRVLPELAALNPRATEQIAAFAERARADDAALEAWAAQVIATIAEPFAHGVPLPRRALLDLPRAVATRVVRLAAAQLGLTLDGDRIDAVLHAARARGRRAALGGGIAAWRDGERLILGGEGGKF